MTFRVSQRGKQYLETARTLLRAAQTMTDRAIADRLKALADDFQRRGPVTSFLSLRYHLQSFKVGADTPIQH